MPDAAYESAVADLVAANRILASQGVLDGFGHVSVRCPGDPSHYLMSCSVAAALVTAEDVVMHDMENRPVREADRQKKLYYERWIHGEVYKARPEVGAIVHSHSPTVVPFASTLAPLRPLLHNASFLGFGAPVFEIRKHVAGSDLMISTAELGRSMASVLGHEAQVVLLRGHGNVVVGPTLQVAVFRAYYTEINARQQLQAIMLGGDAVVYMDESECRATDKVMIANTDRPWALWKAKASADGS
jgi:HCOMODA/2-hydroxy-3-carboxy-muconic semialdehyde decarboxylase